MSGYVAVLSRVDISVFGGEFQIDCFLSFEQRPILCTNAYPCFNDKSYWTEKEKKNILFKKAIKALDAIFQF